MKKIIAVMAIAFMASMTPALAENGRSYVGLAVGGAMNDFNGVDNQAVLGVSVGHDFGLLRVEGNFDHMRADALTSNMVSGMTYLEMDVGKVTPFVGVGMGYVMQGDTAGSAAGLNDNDWAYILSAGASYRLTKNFEFVGQYRYLHSETNVVSSTGQRDFNTDLVTIGARYGF